MCHSFFKVRRNTKALWLHSEVWLDLMTWGKTRVGRTNKYSNFEINASVPCLYLAICHFLLRIFRYSLFLVRFNFIRNHVTRVAEVGASGDHQISLTVLAQSACLQIFATKTPYFTISNFCNFANKICNFS